MSSRVAPVRALLVIAGLLVSGHASAAQSAASRAPLEGCPELPCSVLRNCSSTGVACEPDDRECSRNAVDQQLQIKCEQQCEGGKRQLVYCPPDSGRSDSKIVWILLSLAVLLAIGGSSVAWVVLRKK